MRQTITKKMMAWLRSRINSAKKIKVFFQRFDFVFWGTVMLWIVLALMLIVLVSVMASECVYAMVGGWLGTVGEAAENKTKTLQFIGFGMGGVLAAIGAIAINRRADAQAENNKLIEKGHINERFKSATENLGHSSANVRTASYYQFYYLAKEREEDFRHSVFEILCSCFRSMPRNISHLTEKDGKERPTAECQTLLNILLHPHYQDAFQEFEPDLQRVCLINTQLWNANLLGANLSGADLSNALLRSADLFCANLSGANLSNADLSETNLSETNLSNADLSNADLADANLSKADLKSTNLSSANLSNANLSDAYLVNANLSKANLSNANFTNADLPIANLSNTIFMNTDFSGVNFSEANLSNADFWDTNLSYADFTNANLSNIKLRGTKLKYVFSIDGADFRGAKIDNKPITKDDIPSNRGKYYADWNPPPEKEEN